MFNKTGVFGRNEATPRRETAAPPTPSSPAGGMGNNAAPGVGVDTASRSPVRSLPQGRDAAVPAPPGQPAAAPASPPPVAERVDAAMPAGGTGARLIVGPEVKLKGAEILDCDTLVVEGRVEATMDSRVIRIAEHGSFSGKVSIDVAEIHGTFDGELIARSQLIIHATGRVSGTIRYGKLVADEGGELCGDIHVIAASEAGLRHPQRTSGSEGAGGE